MSERINHGLARRNKAARSSSDGDAQICRICKHGGGNSGPTWDFPGEKKSAFPKAVFPHARCCVLFTTNLIRMRLQVLSARVHSLNWLDQSRSRAAQRDPTPTKDPSGLFLQTVCERGFLSDVASWTILINPGSAEDGSHPLTCSHAVKHGCVRQRASLRLVKTSWVMGTFLGCDLCQRQIWAKKEGQPPETFLPAVITNKQVAPVFQVMFASLSVRIHDSLKVRFAPAVFPQRAKCRNFRRNTGTFQRNEKDADLHVFQLFWNFSAFYAPLVGPCLCAQSTRAEVHLCPCLHNCPIAQAEAVIPSQLEQQLRRLHHGNPYSPHTDPQPRSQVARDTSFPPVPEAG